MTDSIDDDMVTTAKAIATRIGALGANMACGPCLCASYAKQSLLTGTSTTPQDAFDAWCRGMGTTPANVEEFRAAYKVTDWPTGGFHDQVAAVIREVAQCLT